MAGELVLVDDTKGSVVVADVLESLARLEAASVEAIITDPPYELNFMGKGWDNAGVSFRRETWEACLRVLKPGGHMVVFGGTRTHHRMWCAIEDAGFEVRDMLTWLYGTGFPKSYNVGQAIEKLITTGKARRPDRDLGKRTRYRFSGDAEGTLISDTGGSVPLTTEEAQQWEGFGTALKPAVEPILLARKPLSEPTVAANVLKWGVGALNINDTRIGTTKDVPASPRRAVQGAAYGDLSQDPGTGEGWNPNVGRWPANVMLDEKAAEMLDAQSGVSSSRTGQPRKGQRGEGWGMSNTGAEYEDTGGASRFFYCPKASRAEKERGLENLEPITGAEAVNRKPNTAGLKSPRAGAGRSAITVKNPHPTVKPIALMRWLVRLVTPPGGTVVDPFCGSGTTLIAAYQEDHRFIGSDNSLDYACIALTRLLGEYNER